MEEITNLDPDFLKSNLFEGDKLLLTYIGEPPNTEEIILKEIRECPYKKEEQICSRCSTCNKHILYSGNFAFGRGFCLDPNSLNRIKIIHRGNLPKINRVSEI